MPKVFVSYGLAADASRERKRAWSREVSQRITPGRDRVIHFKVQAIEGAENGAPFCPIVEDIEVEGGGSSNAVAGPGMSYILETINDLVDLSPMRSVYGSHVLPALLPLGIRLPVPTA